jgi:hypothetical protein
MTGRLFPCQAFPDGVPYGTVRAAEIKSLKGHFDELAIRTKNRWCEPAESFWCVPEPGWCRFREQMVPVIQNKKTTQRWTTSYKLKAGTFPYTT